MVTINSDDPLFFDSSVASDMRRLAELSDFDAKKHTIYAIDGSWATSEKKEHFRAEVREWWNGPTGE